MLAFWGPFLVITAILTGLALAAMFGMARLRRTSGEDPALDVHRRQLAEIDDLVGRGLLSPEEQAESRAEAGRRLLAAADRPAAPARPGGWPVIYGTMALVGLASVSIYAVVGSPGTADAAMADRIAAWRRADPSTLTAPQIAAVLTRVAVEKPNDPELLRMLASARMQSGDAFGAANALRQAVALRPNDAGLLAGLGEAFVAVSGGEIGDDARRAFAEANRLDPAALSPRYHLAMASLADGRTAEALAGLKRLLADLPAEDPRRASLQAEIARIEGGAAPEAMDDAIRGMVEGLAARLEAEPDDPDGWARLVRAYSVLGETAKRDAALARARLLFKDRPEVLRTLESASERPQ
ncbi:MAG TPA: c-type cytochrome biogenesis protein CcmI [Caulobacter sp.]|nr:c-type cytochrome biogenesis protein CcmI [Caulobacter sp.]